MHFKNRLIANSPTEKQIPLTLAECFNALLPSPTVQLLLAYDIVNTADLNLLWKGWKVGLCNPIYILLSEHGND